MRRKILIMGLPGAGKTTLAKALISGRASGFLIG
jgi:adenylate kinase family enzyme